MVMVMRYSHLSRTQTALLFKRDYTTVLWAEKVVEEKIKSDPAIKNLVSKAIRLLNRQTEDLGFDVA